MRHASEAEIEQMAHDRYGHELKMNGVTAGCKIKAMKTIRDMVVDQGIENAKVENFGSTWKH